MYRQIITAAGLTLLAAISLLAPPPVHAAQSPTQRIRLAEFDLATPEGQRALDRRIDAAIEAVCAQPYRKLPRSRPLLKSIDRCRATALTGVRQQLQMLGVRPAVSAAQNR